MALTVSQKCKNIHPSVTLAIDSRAKQLRAMGLDVIGFGAGEPDFDTPKYIKDAAKDALDAGLTKYTPVAGTLELKSEIQAKLMRDNGLEYELTDIIVSTGAKQCLFNALSAIIDPGDEVLIPSPAWVSYPEIVSMVGGTPVMVNGLAENSYVVPAEELEKHITDKTKALILNSPNNPTGSVLDREVLKAYAELAVKYGFYVISDEIYEKLIYDGGHHVSIASLGEDIKAQTIVINGVSKSYAMTGWRIGYAAGPKNVIKAMTSFQSHTTSNANSIAQHAAAVALTNGERFMHESLMEFTARRNLMYDMLSSINGLKCSLPQGAFYMMLDISSLIGKSVNGKVIGGSDDFAGALLESKMVAVVPARAFGDDHCVRLSYATTREKIIVGISRIEEFVKECE
ncbi:MAG: pyridoxal phosphate-dependent aminotransferase [Clostridia bacterium]|nr:pyridoxal phosphate-dependent aminotransferase [Clostridia bacterium]